MTEAEREYIRRELAMPLSEKNRRAVQEKCPHDPEAVSSFTFASDTATFTDTVCVDCGKHWREDH